MPYALAINSYYAAGDSEDIYTPTSKLSFMLSHIIVLSDTHCGSIDQLPSKVLEEIEEADLIVHAGDYTSISLVDQLRRLKPFYGVYGNMDEVRVKSSLPPEVVIDLRGFKIGLTHPPEGGSPLGIKRRLRKRFDVKLDAIIFGHTHHSEISTDHGILFMNPGALKGSLPYSRSYIVLDISDRLEPKIVYI